LPGLPDAHFIFLTPNDAYLVDIGRALIVYLELLDRIAAKQFASTAPARLPSPPFHFLSKESGKLPDFLSTIRHRHHRHRHYNEKIVSIMFVFSCYNLLSNIIKCRNLAPLIKI